MGKIKTWYRSIPIWLMFFLFAGAALIVCTFVSNRVVDMVNHKLTQLVMNCTDMFVSTDPPPEGGQIYYAVTGDDEVAIEYYSITALMTEEDAQTYRLQCVLSSRFFKSLQKQDTANDSLCPALPCSVRVMVS